MSRTRLRIALGLALALVAAGAAGATESPCGGEASAGGPVLRVPVLHGPVLHVLDGRTLCVALGAAPSQWAEVTLDDAPASSSWSALMSVAFGKDVTCTVNAIARRGICTIDGRSVGAQLLDPAVAKAAVAWRPPAEPPREAPNPVPLRIATAQF